MEQQNQQMLKQIFFALVSIQNLLRMDEANRPPENIFAYMQKCGKAERLATKSISFIRLLIGEESSTTEQNTNEP